MGLSLGIGLSITHKQAKGPLGPELVVNGTFNSDISSWVDSNTEGTIAWNAGGFMDMARNSGSGASIATQFVAPTIAGRTYQLEYEIISLSHSIQPKLGAVGGTTETTIGVKTGLYLADFSTEQVKFNLAGDLLAIGSIDNVSVKEVV